MATNNNPAPRPSGQGGTRRTVSTAHTRRPASGSAPQAGSQGSGARPSGAPASGGGQPPRRRKKKKFNFWLFLLKFICVCCCLGVMVASVLAVLLSMYVVKVTANDATLLDLDNMKLSYTTQILAYNSQTENWEVYAELSRDNDRKWVDHSAVPENLKWAFVCTEDKTFYTHHGVNIKRTFSAMVNLVLDKLTNGRITLYDSNQGASTIDQQLIKNITGDDKQDPMRKIREIFRAIGLDNRYSKDTILEAYMNTISLTGTIAGVQAGAQAYFGKDVSELTLAECASIASITKNPTKFNPYTNPENHVTRRNHILGLMLEQGKITQAEYDEAVATPLVMAEDHTEEVVNTSANNSYFTDAIIRALIEDIKKEEGFDSDSDALNIIYNSGLRIYATVDPYMQTEMEKLMLNEDGKTIPWATYQEEVAEADLKEDDQLVYNEDGTPKMSKDGNYYRYVSSQAAMVTMNYQGEVKALVGGLGDKQGDLVFNRATEAYRQTGSSMKPLTAYALGIQDGAITYSTPLYDVPLYTKEDRKILNEDYCRKYGYPLNPNDARVQANPDCWRDWPRNVTGDPTGRMFLAYDGLAQSVNTIAVQVGVRLTADRMFSFAYNTLNLSRLNPEADADYGPIVLGSQTVGVSPLELCAAYQIFNGGKYTTPHFYTEVTYANGDVYLDKTNDITTTQALTEEAATVMNKMLQNVIQLPGGTAYGMGPTAGNMASAGKTGTTNDWNDLTYVGLTPYYVTSVWWGYDVLHSLYPNTNKPLRILWRDYMNIVQEGLESKEFFYSDNVQQLRFCADTGDLAGPGCTNVRVGYYIPSNIPEQCTAH